MTGLPIGESNARVDADGSFVVNNVPRATHRVSVTGLPADAYVAFATVGGQDVLSPGVQVVPDMSSLKVWISGSGARLDGAVSVGDAPFTGAQVVLIPDDRHGPTSTRLPAPTSTAASRSVESLRETTALFA